MPEKFFFYYLQPSASRWKLRTHVPGGREGGYDPKSTLAYSEGGRVEKSDFFAYVLYGWSLRVFSRYTYILANYDQYFAIFVGKMTNTWATYVSISKNPTLSNIHNQLITKYTKLRKIRNVYSFS